MRNFNQQLGLAVLGFLGAIVGQLQPSLAADLGGATPPTHVPSEDQRAWTISVTPYGWLTFLRGETGVRGRTADIDANPIDVLEHLAAVPLMGYAEARRGPWAFYNDIFIAKFGIDVNRARSFGALTLDASLGLDLDQTVVEVGGTYEITKWRSGGGGPFSGVSAIDLLVGARYWRQEAALSLALTGTLDTTGLVLSGSRAIARSGSVDWIDPVVGARLRHQLAPGQELVLRGDIGGFDVGSRFSWNVLAAYNWDVATRHGVTYGGVLGYRLLSVDYETGSGLSKYEYDVLQHGPVIGLTAKF